ncbi:MAG: 4-hydroxy-tetrahydrodipicolinate synthase [Geminicoccaceae bacterium]
MFHGSIVALVTPFRNGGIDEPALQSLVEWHVEQGTHGLVPVGTTGESPTLSHGEHERVVEVVIEAAGRRLPVIAGAGSNSTAEAISLARHAKRAGAVALLVVTPYYNKPTQAGLYAHFKAIHDADELPIIIYNIPARSVVDMSVETMAELAKLRNIVGVKDATCDLVRPLLTAQACGDDFCQLSGEDGTALAFLAGGGHGCISVTANAAPRLCAEMQEAWQRGDAAGALAIHQRLMPLHKALFVETSPAPVKYALARLGKCSAAVRLPLVEPKEASKQTIEAAMVSAGLIN